jgi:hypothetical protein
MVWCTVLPPTPTRDTLRSAPAAIPARHLRSSLGRRISKSRRHPRLPSACVWSSLSPPLSSMLSAPKSRRLCVSPSARVSLDPLYSLHHADPDPAPATTRIHSALHGRARSASISTGLSMEGPRGSMEGPTRHHSIEPNRRGACCTAPVSSPEPTRTPSSPHLVPLSPRGHLGGQHELAFFSDSGDATGPRHPVPKLIFLEGIMVVMYNNSIGISQCRNAEPLSLFGTACTYSPICLGHKKSVTAISVLQNIN